MKHNFCTLFDSYYLTRGIALYNSLELHCNNFHLYIYAFDDKSCEVLNKLNLVHATIISLKQFENEALLRVKPFRTIAEYCWTCTASTIWYSIHQYQLTGCTYLDADLLFFSSPEIIFDEINNNSIAISPHNFSPHLKSSEVCGKYCVQFTYFKNDVYGLEALKWWKDSCIEWCYARMEDDKYGDQKYLDYFEKKFKNVHIIKHIGAGVAPWNITKYKVEIVESKVTIQLKKSTLPKLPLIFYHYQSLKFEDSGVEIISKAAYLKIPAEGLKFIYEPYINILLSIKSRIDGFAFVNKKIIFHRTLKDSVVIFIRVNLKSIKIIRKIYYLLQKQRYSKPANIGGTIN